MRINCIEKGVLKLGMSCWEFVWSQCNYVNYIRREGSTLLRPEAWPALINGLGSRDPSVVFFNLYVKCTCPHPFHVRISWYILLFFHLWALNPKPIFCAIYKYTSCANTLIPNLLYVSLSHLLSFEPCIRSFINL